MRGHGTFGSECFPLLDAEAVLLIDDDESEIEKLHVIADERVGSDDDSCLTAGGRERSSAPFGHCELSGDERGVQLSGEVWSQSFDDGAQVLAREHFGGCQQRGLSPRLGDRQHPAQSDDRLTRADFALHEAIHRRLRHEICRDLGAHALLIIGEGERECAVELREQTVGCRHPHDCGLRPQQRPLLQESGLQNEGLLKPERFTGCSPIAVFLRAVDQLESAGELQQTPALAHLCRHRVRDERQRVENERYGLLNLPRRHGRGGWIDRHGSSHPRFRLSLVGGLVGREEFVIRMCELPYPPIRPDLAREDAARARLQFVLAPPLVEEGEGEDAGAVADAHFEDAAVAVLHATLHRIEHPTDDGDGLIEWERVERGQLPALHVPARVVGEQVADGCEAQSLRKRRRRAPADDGAEALVEGRVGHVPMVCRAADA